MLKNEWDLIQTIFEQAVALEGDARTSFIDESCSTNPTLRREVERLLAAHDAAENFRARSTACGALSCSPLARPKMTRPKPWAATASCACWAAAPWALFTWGTIRSSIELSR